VSVYYTTSTISQEKKLARVFGGGISPDGI
jgi:hypothetical protein